MKTTKGKKKNKGTVVSNNVFNGVVWDGQVIESVNNISKALLNLTEIFKSQHIQIDSLLNITHKK